MRNRIRFAPRSGCSTASIATGTGGIEAEQRETIDPTRGAELIENSHFRSARKLLAPPVRDLSSGRFIFTIYLDRRLITPLEGLDR